MTPPSSARRLLFFAYYFPPLGGAGSQRALSFVRHLPEHGWEVVVVAPREGVFGTDDSITADGLPGVTVIRTGTLEPSVLLRKVLPRKRRGVMQPGGDYVKEANVGSIGSALRDWARGHLYFPDSCRGWIAHAVRAAGREHSRSPFDAVLSSSPPVSAHVAAQRFSAKVRLPWIADWRDPWVEHLGSEHPRIGDARALEISLFKQAFASVTAAPGITSLVSEKVPAALVTTVANGFDPSQFVACSKEPARDGVFRILYSGTLYPPSEQYPGAFFGAVSRLRADPGMPQVRIQFMGKTDAGAVELASRSGVSDLVEYLGFQPHARCVEAMAEAHLLLMIAYNRRDGAFNVEVPAKTYEYLAARRPILALADPKGEASQILGGRQGVWVRSPRDVPGIEEALRAAMRVENPVLPPWSDIHAFCRAAQVAKLAGILEQTVRSARR